MSVIDNVEEKNRRKALDAGNLSAIKVLIGSCNPLVGATIAVWDGYWNFRKEKLLTQFVERIEKELEEKVDFEYLNSEDFFDLISRAIQARVRSRSEKKAQIILELLLENAMKDRDVQFPMAFKERFLSALDELLDEEIVFLVEFLSGKYEYKTKQDIYNMNDDSRSVAMDVLFSKGFLNLGRDHDKYIVASEFGRQFVAYLKFLGTKS